MSGLPVIIDLPDLLKTTLEELSKKGSLTGWTVENTYGASTLVMEFQSEETGKEGVIEKSTSNADFKYWEIPFWRQQLQSVPNSLRRERFRRVEFARKKKCAETNTDVEMVNVSTMTPCIGYELRSRSTQTSVVASDSCGIVDATEQVSSSGYPTDSSALVPFQPKKSSINETMNSDGKHKDKTTQTDSIGFYHPDVAFMCVIKPLSITGPDDEEDEGVHFLQPSSPPATEVLKKAEKIETETSSLVVETEVPSVAEIVSSIEERNPGGATEPPPFNTDDQNDQLEEEHKALIAAQKPKPSARKSKDPVLFNVVQNARAVNARQQPEPNRVTFHDENVPKNKIKDLHDNEKNKDIDIEMRRDDEKSRPEYALNVVYDHRFGADTLRGVTEGLTPEHAIVFDLKEWCGYLLLDGEESIPPKQMPRWWHVLSRSTFVIYVIYKEHNLGYPSCLIFGERLFFK